MDPLRDFHGRYLRHASTNDQGGHLDQRISIPPITDDAEESAKDAFYREGLKLPRPYMAKLFRWAAFGDWWDAYALVKVPTLVIGGRVSKVPVKIAQGIHEAVPGSSFVVFEADEGGGHAMFWEGPQKYNDSLRTFMRSY